MYRKKVSVILPSLNVVNYIDCCLESVRTQTLKEIEIICVDAGSADGTLEKIIFHQNNDERIKIIESDMRSYGYQVNLGIKAAESEYIAIIETDDLIEKEMLETLYSYIDGTNADFAKSRFYRFFTGNNTEVLAENCNTDFKNNNGLILDLESHSVFRLTDPNHIWAGLYRKEFLTNNDIWFNETPGASYQDTSFSVLVNMMANRCIYIDKCFYHYRMDRPESSVKCADKWRCVIDEFEYVDSYFEKHPYKDIKQKYMVDEFRIMAYRWNMLRLDEEKRRLFHSSIANEIEPILNNKEELSSFNDCIKDYLRTISDLNEADKQIMDKMVARKDIDAIIELAKQRGPFVFVGAGNWFSDICDIQELLGVTLVKEVTDNNSDIHGSYVHEYQVKSVNELAKTHINDMWLIANKHHSEDIKEQLISEGIKEKNIISITVLPKWYELCQ